MMRPWLFAVPLACLAGCAGGPNTPETASSTSSTASGIRSSSSTPSTTSSTTRTDSTAVDKDDDPYLRLAKELERKGIKCPKGPEGGCTNCKPLGELLFVETALAPVAGAPDLKSFGRSRVEAFRRKGKPCGPGGGCTNCLPPTPDDLRELFRDAVAPDVTMPR